MLFSKSYAPSAVFGNTEPVPTATRQTSPSPAPATEIEKDTNQLPEDKENEDVNRVKNDHDLKKQRSNEMIANVLFPATASTSTVPLAHNKPRYSLPLGPVPKKPQLNNRKSLSPRHAASRSLNSGTLLALPLANQFATLKARNVILEAQVKEVNSKGDGALFRATTRIATLEKSLQDKDVVIEHMEKNGGAAAAEQLKKSETMAALLKDEVERVTKLVEALTKQGEEMKMEKEGWESEATRLAAELEATVTTIDSISPPVPTAAHEEEIERLKSALASQTMKRNDIKLINAKLRCAMENQRLEGKFQTGLFDIAARKEEQDALRVEYEVATLRSKVDLSEIEKEEFEETIVNQDMSKAKLQNARTALLEAHAISQATLTTTKQELNLTKSLLNAERALTASLNKELTKTKQALENSTGEIAEIQERCEELEAEVDRMEGEAAGLTKADKKKEKMEMKEMLALKATLAEEVSNREEAEVEVQSLTTTLKSAQSDLKKAEKSLAQAEKATEVANKLAESNSSMLQNALTSLSHATANANIAPVIASKPKAKISKAKVVAPIEEEEEEEEVEEDTSMIELKAAAKAKAKPKPRAKKVVVPIVAPVSPIESDDSQDDGSVFRPKKKAAAAALAAAPKKVATTPKEVVKKVKVVKAKAVVVLGDKNVNAKESRAGSVAATGKGKKRELVAVAEDEEEDDEPVMKKKKSLFTGAKKFEWGKVVETSENSLGLPSALSPVKITGAGRPSLNGRGLSTGRKSIFG